MDDVDDNDSEDNATTNRGRDRRVPAVRRVRLGNFLNSHGNIKSPRHGRLLDGIVQVLAGAEGGITQGLSRNHRLRHLKETVEVGGAFLTRCQLLFAAGGPLEGYVPIQPELLSRYINKALKKAHDFWKQYHSNDETGENAEEVPFWMRGFFELFRAEEADITPAAANRRAQVLRANISASIVGQQGAIGESAGNTAVSPRNQASSNEGRPQLRSRYVGRISTETRIEGDDDVVQPAPAPRTPSTRTSTPNHRNVVTDSSSTSSLTNEDTPSTRYHGIQESRSAMNRFTDALTNVISQTPRPYSQGPPPRPPPHPLLDLITEYDTIRRNLQAPGLSQNDRRFFNAGLETLQYEMERRRREMERDHRSDGRGGPGEGKTEE